MRIIDEIQLDFDDVLIAPQRSTLNSRSEVEPWREFKNLIGTHSFNCIPITAANMGTVGTIRMAKILSANGYMCCLEKHIPVEDIIDMYRSISPDRQNRIFVSIGVKEPMERFLSLKRAGYDKIGINIDVPNGYIPNLKDRVIEARKMFPDSFIVAGTVVSGDIAQDLILAGADCIRCGIGCGSVCTTRIKSGVGRPQLSTIMECANACHQMNAYCMCDGGLKTPGDICKAFCAGADFIMTGSMFAGCDEAEGDVVERNGKKYKQYYGMSSKLAQEKHFGGFQANVRASEGREKLIPCTGPLEDIIKDINGGIRSMMTYIGARKLKNVSRQATFYRVNRQVNDKFANCENIQ